MIPGVVRKKFLDYKTMAGKTVEDIFGEKLSGMTKLSASLLSSVLIKNEGGKLNLVELPSSVQWSPVFAFNVDDFNKDGKPDILSAGNFYGVLPYEGRYDAGYGNVLINNNSSFQSLSAVQSGFALKGEVRDIKKLRSINNRSIYIVARNNDACIFFKTAK